MLQVVDRLFDILELFLLQKEKYTLVELAELSGCNITTTARIVNKLVERGYLNKIQSRKGYRLGKKILEYRKEPFNRVELRTTVYPFLIELSKSIDETIIFTAWDGLAHVLIAAIPSPHMLLVVPADRALSDVELYNSSSGKIILANMSESELNKYCNTSPMKAYTPNSIMDINDLKSQLAAIKQEGVAYNLEELRVGESSVASAIRNGTGTVIGTLAVIGPAARLTRARLRQFAPSVKSVADDISHALGY